VNNLTEQELEKIAAKGAETAITHLLEKLGIDAENFRECQADFAHLRKQRKAYEQVTTVTTRVVITALVTGFIAALWMGIKDFLHLQP
jgi:hypothetical protein